MQQAKIRWRKQMAGDIPPERQTGWPAQTTLNYLDIVGKAALYGGSTEAALGAAVGYGAGTFYGTAVSVVTLGRLLPLSAVPEVAAEASVALAAPGILAGVAGLDVYALKKELEFDQAHPDIALSVLEGTAGGPGL